MERKTKLEILQETYNYYSDPNKRGINKNGGCSYLTEDGNMCAVGRCLTNPKTMQEFPYGVDKFEREGVHIERRLKPEYRGHSLDFWEDLQGWHDNHRNFVGDSISVFGEQHYQKLVEKYTEK